MHIQKKEMGIPSFVTNVTFKSCDTTQRFAIIIITLNILYKEVFKLMFWQNVCCFHCSHILSMMKTSQGVILLLLFFFIYIRLLSVKGCHSKGALIIPYKLNSRVNKGRRQGGGIG